VPSIGYKVKFLSAQTRLDICQTNCAINPEKWIFEAKGDRKLKLLKIMLTNHCSFDCKYCFNPSAKTKLSFTPEELASVFMYLNRRKVVSGLFLSSGMGSNEEATMERMLETVEILRKNYFFTGYIHLKVLPGSERDQVERAVQLANRVSINIEAPSKSRLAELSSCKDYSYDILRRRKWISKAIRNWNNHHNNKKSTTTQMVVGAGSETDLEILKAMKKSYSLYGLQRVYYSGFMPLKGTPLEHKHPENKQRVINLYRVDRLYKVYGFDLKEISSIVDEEGNLPRNDPKKVLAEKFLNNVDINSASLEEILRIPDIGPQKAKKILELRKGSKIGVKELKRIGVHVKKVAPYIDIKEQTTLDDFLRR